MKNETNCIINGYETDAARLFEAIKSGNKIQAVKLLKEVSGTDLGTSLAVVDAIINAGEMPEEISFAGQTGAEVKFRGRQAMAISGKKSGGCGAAAAGLVLLSILPCLIK